MLALCVVLGGACAAAACQRDDATKTPTDPRSAAPRIASFSPAITATVVALGWESALVGRTPWCTSTAPIVGSLNDVDLESLSKVKPNLILVQQTRTGAPAQLEQVAHDKGWKLEFIPATSLEDLRRLPRAVAQAMGMAAPVDPKTLESALDQELAACRAAEQLSPAILLYSSDPVAAFGPDTYLAQAWVAMGGTLAFKSGGNPNLSSEELFAMRPRSIVVVRGEDASMDRAQGTLVDACARRGVELVEVRAPQLLRPGPELTAGLKRLRAAIQEHSAKTFTHPVETAP